MNRFGWRRPWGSLGGGDGAAPVFVDFQPGLLEYLYPSSTRVWHRMDEPGLITLRNDTSIIRRADAGNADKPATTAAETNEPLFIASAYNGLPCARFDGSNDYLKCESGNIGNTSLTPTAGQAFTIVLMHAVDGTAAASDFGFSQRSYDASQYAGTLGFETGIAIRWGAAGAATQSPSIYTRNALNITNFGLQDGNLNILIITWDGATLTAYPNGALTGTVLTVGAFAEQTAELIFGALEVGRREAKMDEVEFFCMDAELTTADRQFYEGYFAHKYARTAALDAGHPYKTTAPLINIARLL